MASTLSACVRSWRAALFLIAGLFAFTAEAQTTASIFYVLSNDGLTLRSGPLASPTSAAAPVSITGVDANETLVAIDVRPQNQTLYGLGVNAVANTATLYCISPRTGVANRVGPIGAIAFVDAGSTPIDFPDPNLVGWDIDFNPAVDRVRVVAGTLNFRVNPNTGLGVDSDPGTPATTNPDGAINGLTTTVAGTAYTNSQPNNGGVTTQYTLDPATDALYIQTPPNNGTQTNALGITLGGTPLDFSTAVGFDIPPGVNAPASNTPVTTGSGFALLSVGGTTGLYAVNLVTGAATLIGNAPTGRSMALQPSLAPVVTLNVASDSLLRFDASTPGTTTTQALATASLVAGETLVGLDCRPQTGQFYGLGVDATADTGTLYLIDPQTGAISIAVAGTASSITFAGVDLPDAATAGYGFDFNPTVDRIRVTTSTGLNFRMNPNTGLPAAATVDGGINGLPGGSTGVSATAYTNSYTQSLVGGVTTQYTIDAASDTLFIQNPPNNGTQTQAKALTLGGVPLDITDVNGFDIPGSVVVATSSTVAQGDGYFAATVGGVTGLYRVNLATGATTSLGAVAAGTTPLRGLTVFGVTTLSVQDAVDLVIYDGAKTIDFGTTLVGTPSTSTVKITNVGAQALNYTTTFDTGAPYSVTSNASGVVAAGGTTTIELTFDPSVGSGTVTDTLHIVSNDVTVPSFEVLLTGNATAPVLQVEFPAGTVIADNAETIDFGNTRVGTPSTAEVTVKNTGNSALNYTTSFDTGVLYAVTSNGAGSIPAGGSTTIGLTFDPALGTGTLTDALHINSDDTTVPSFDISLTGFAVEPVTDAGATVTTGPTRINPLVLAGLDSSFTIATVSDVTITIGADGRTLIIPGTFVGTSFTYTASNGAITYEGTVNVIQGIPVVGATSYSGLLFTAAGDIIGTATATISAKGIATVQLLAGTSKASTKITVATVPSSGANFTALGYVTLDRNIDGTLDVFLGALGGNIGGTLVPVQKAATATKYHIALASLNTSIVGGGYAIATVTAKGLVKITGLLPDGVPFSGATTLRDNATFAFFSMTKGPKPPTTVGGELSTASLLGTDISGELRWVKLPQLPKVKGVYLNGVNTTLSATGSIYTGLVPLPNGAGTLTLDVDDFALPEVNPVVVSAAGIPAPALGSALKTWTGVKVKVGKFSATIQVPGITKPVKGSGIYLPKTGSAWGYFPGTTTGGRILLTVP